MKPTERFRQRYVAFSLAVEGKPPSATEAKRLVHEHFLSFFGELGIASLAFKLVSYEEGSGMGIVRCERSAVEETILCMALLSEWEGRSARMEPISTSGTIRRVSRK
ncbi:MAG: hypothetical protein N3E51_03280 [Candidatus Micrarchaeota archaeon]|nr:hypothetical protein [Candidatus Micrarchaeota archaeon]